MGFPALAPNSYDICILYVLISCDLQDFQFFDPPPDGGSPRGNDSKPMRVPQITKISKWGTSKMWVPRKGVVGTPKSRKNRSSQDSLPIVEILSGLQESSFSLFRSPQLHSSEKSRNWLNFIKFIDFHLFPPLSHVGRRPWRSPFNMGATSYNIVLILCDLQDRDPSELSRAARKQKGRLYFSNPEGQNLRPHETSTRPRTGGVRE